jgi:hypothetical protein
MLKFTIRVGLFAGLLLALIALSGKLFRNNQKLQSFKHREYKENSKAIDIAIFGTSHAYTAYDPKILENRFEIQAFNFGAPVQNLKVTELAVKEILKETRLKLGVVDIFRSAILEPPFTNRVADFQYESLDYLPLSSEKINLHNHFYGARSVLNVFPTIRDHVLWNERFFQPPYALSRNVDYYKGYMTDLYFDKKSWNAQISDKKPVRSPQLIDSLALTQGQKNAIDDIVAAFREYEVPLLFVSAPVHRKYMDDIYYTYQHLISGYLKEIGAAYIDYNNLWEELGLHHYDFKDISHVNAGGALKITRHLASYIKTHYNTVVAGEDDATINHTENRYHYLDKGFKKAIGHSEIGSKKAGRETGVDDIAVFDDGYGRLEVLLVGDTLQPLWLRVAYEMPESETRNQPTTLNNRIVDSTYGFKVFLPNRKEGSTFQGYRYSNKEFKFVKIDCPFTSIRNLKVFLGSKMPRTPVMALESLQLK